MKGNMKLRALARKSAIWLLACASFAMTPSQDAEGQRAHKACSNGTLFGDYGTKLEGTILGANLALRTLVLAHFDGEGNIKEVDHAVLNGTPPAADED